MTKFHSDDYIRFLRSIRPDNMGEYSKLLQRFNVGEDCPVFDGLYEFCQLSSGGSVASAVKMNKKVTSSSQIIFLIDLFIGSRYCNQLVWWIASR